MMCVKDKEVFKKILFTLGMIVCLFLIGCRDKSANHYNTQGCLYLDEDQYDLAVSEFTKAIDVDPEYAIAYLNRGAAYYGKGEYDKAWEDIRKAQGLGCQVNPEILTRVRAASEGQKIELPANERVTVTTTTGTWEVSYGGLYKGLYQFYCKEKAAGEHEDKRFSRTEGKVGNVLNFGITTTRFHYSEFNPMQRIGSSTESELFFRFLVSKVDAEEKIATIIVLPEEE